MKNIFDYLTTEENTLNEEVFESFANWMFEGDDPTNALSRTFLRWSVLYIVKDSGDNRPHNSDFYAFFQEFDRTDFDAFLNHILKYADIAVQVERILGGDQTTGYPDDIQSNYWYFYGTVMEHAEKKNLFPEQSKTPKNVLKFEKKRKTSSSPDTKDDPLSEDDLKSVSNVFAVILLVLLVGFFLFNFIFKG